MISLHNNMRLAMFPSQLEEHLKQAITFYKFRLSAVLELTPDEVKMCFHCGFFMLRTLNMLVEMNF